MNSHTFPLFFTFHTGYDGTKTIAKEYGYEDAPPLHIASSITASLFASMFSAPADLLMTKYMASFGKSSLTIGDLQENHKTGRYTWIVERIQYIFCETCSCLFNILNSV